MINTCTPLLLKRILGCVKMNRRSSLERKEEIDGYIFLFPNLMLFLILVLFPFIYSLFLSFTDGNVLAGIFNLKFIGLINYKKMLNDEWVITSLYNNLIFSLVVVFVGLSLSLVFALILNTGVYLKKVLRAVYFIPYISNVVAISIVWYYMYSPDGPINSILGVIGIKNPPYWMMSTKWTLYALCIIMIWINLGYNILIFLAGIQGIPFELYEASTIDGANWISKFRFITLPMLYPTITFLLITNMIVSFQSAFTLLSVTTKGGPGNASNLIVYYIYRVGFREGNLGYAASVSFMLFVIIMALTLFMWHSRSKASDYL